MKERIIQIMPITGNEYPMFMSTYEDGSETEWSLVGAALMDNGKVYPLVWDGHWMFKAVDPYQQIFSAFMNQALHKNIREVQEVPDWMKEGECE